MADFKTSKPCRLLKFELTAMILMSISRFLRVRNTIDIFFIIFAFLTFQLAGVIKCKK